MPPSLSSLPPPPQGQTGVTLSSLKSLPPPPTGQQGMTLAQVQSQPQATPSESLWSNLVGATVNTGKNYMANVAPAAQDIMGGGNIGAAVNDLSKGNVVSGVEHATLGTAADAVSAIFAPIAAPIQTLLAHTAAVNAANPSITDVDVQSPQAQAARQQLATWAQANPLIARTLTDAFTVGTAALGSGALDTSVSDAATAVKNSVVKSATTASNIAGAVKDAVLGTPEARAAAQASAQSAQESISMGNELSQIQDTIAPKVTAKETKLALADGRVAPGSDPTLLRDGTPDQVLPSTEQAKASLTIHQNIPGAATMKAPELYTALDAKISDMSIALRPAMEATPISESTITKLTSDWEALKAKQLADPYTPTTANLEKLQTNFQTDFLDKSNLDNMGDLWDTRIKYDNSVPTGVKNATSLSSDVLQAQKAVWLQNRGVLNAAINDAASGMGEVSQKTFSEMSDLYNAQKGIQSSYKVPKTGAPSTLKRVQDTIKSHPYVTAATAVGADKLIKTTTGLGF